MEIIFEITLSPDESESKSVLDSGFHAVDSGFQVLDSTLCQWNLDSWFQYWLGFFELYCGFQSPEFRIPQTQFSRIPESVFPYAMRSLFVAKDISPHDTFQPYELSADQITVLAFWSTIWVLMVKSLFYCCFSFKGKSSYTQVATFVMMRRCTQSEWQSTC